MISNAGMTDKDIMMGVLGDYKLAIDALSHAATEAANESLKRDFINALNSTFEEQKEVWNAINQRGWYSVKPAQMQDIQETRNKFRQPAGIM
ncbi:coat F domain protein [Thermoanaerobacterium thermosaccharolyticum]|uniref:Coat F domain protein n=1 Tax=Thermoanaerobacterium thermosaccharolyticum TaxID=1517 RepID=A0A223I006_THETR|nr:spore coat protein [Thermoanaerobacterium thermosaccharolyticum]AST57977.1 coat F domain protein [Thermoanaerobacterium thermosaccharolyticum]